MLESPRSERCSSELEFDAIVVGAGPAGLCCALGIAAHTDTLIRVVDRRVSQLWGRASKQAKSDQGALPALTVLLAGLRRAIAQTTETKATRFDAMVELIQSYDAEDLKPQSIAARQRAILVEQIRQIRPLLKSLVGLDLHADDASHWPGLTAAWKAAYQSGTDQLTTPMAPPKTQARTNLSVDEPKFFVTPSTAHRHHPHVPLCS